MPASPICKQPRKTYDSMREKNIEFAKRILLWLILISIAVTNIDVNEVISIIPFYMLLSVAIIYLFLVIGNLLRDYREIYGKVD
jgi:uncharacterized membrane protein